MRQPTFFNITDENNIISVTKPRYWFTAGSVGTVKKLNRSLDLRSQIDFELHVEDIRHRENQIKKGENEYNLYDLDIHEKEISRKLKRIRYIDLEDMVFRMELTYDESIEIFDAK